MRAPFLAAALLPLLAAGCSSVRPVRQPAQFIAETQPPVVYVVMNRTGRVLEIAAPRFSGDSVVGVLATHNVTIALPMSDVYRIDARRRDGLRTAMLGAGVALAAGVVAYVILGTADGRSNWFCDYSTEGLEAGGGGPRCTFTSS